MRYRTKKILQSKLKRAMRWEFWPMWVFYPPVVVWICLLAIRYRSALLFTAANPGMNIGGLVDDNKAANLLAIQALYPDSVAATHLIAPGGSALAGANKAIEAARDHQIQYPLILKPNSGQRGLGVEVVRNEAELRNYFERHGDQHILLQEHVPGREFGVFYMREPDQPNGYIFSITEKHFPVLTGDGQSTLEQLILEDKRAIYMAVFLLDMYEGQLDRVLAKGEPLQLVEIGSHCRGSIFLEGSDQITPELEQHIDTISKAIDGYYFGRYDLRVPSNEDLRAGKNLKVIEANGVSSESTNIYDPEYGLFHAYKVMFRQWSSAFRIAAKNRARGHAPARFRDLFSSLARLNKG